MKSIHVGYVGLMGNLHYFQILDFLLGWFTLDLAGDDYATRLARRAAELEEPKEPAASAESPPPKGKVAPAPKEPTPKTRPQPAPAKPPKVEPEPPEEVPPPEESAVATRPEPPKPPPKPAPKTRPKPLAQEMPKKPVRPAAKGLEKKQDVGPLDAQP